MNVKEVENQYFTFIKDQLADLVTEYDEVQTYTSQWEYHLIKKEDLREIDWIINNELLYCNLTEIKDDERFQLLYSEKLSDKKIIIVMTLKKTRKCFKK